MSKTSPINPSEIDFCICGSISNMHTPNCAEISITKYRIKFQMPSQAEAKSETSRGFETMEDAFADFVAKHQSARNKQQTR